jgi:hypothetical protein
VIFIVIIGGVGTIVAQRDRVALFPVRRMLVRPYE